MFRIFAILSIMISPVLADPEDFPPTAFQLAQIRHYVGQDEKARHYRDYQITEPHYIAYAVPESLKNTEEWLLSHLPKKPTKGDWRSYVQMTLDEISRIFPGAFLVESFQEKGTIDLITNAILAEQSSREEGKVVLWRVGQTALNEDAQKKDYLSFSHGLFSGFLFDGYKYHLYPFRNVSSCTYTYFSSKARGNRLLREGISGFAARVIEVLPEFFSQVSPTDYEDVFGVEKWPGATDSFWGAKTQNKLNIRRTLDIASEWYSRQEGYPRQQELQGLFGEVGIMFKNDSLFPLQQLSLWGLKLTHGQLAEMYHEATLHRERGGLRTGWLKDQRGEFVKPKYAVYGSGELYHPKVKLPDNPEVITLLDNVTP